MTRENVMTKIATISLESTDTDWLRVRFVICVAIYGAAIGVATILVNFLVRADAISLPQHRPLWTSLLFSGAAAVAGITITGPAAYWIFGTRHVFSTVEKRKPRSLIVWIVLGFGYGIAFPLLMGAYFLPLSFYFHDFASGLTSAPQLVSRVFDVVLIWPVLALVFGNGLFFTGLIAGALFGSGGWIIDRFNASTSLTTAKYGTWIMSMLLSIAVIATVIVVPETILARLG